LAKRCELGQLALREKAARNAAANPRMTNKTARLMQIRISHLYPVSLSGSVAV
jgi:hypothetical protein